MKKLFALLLAMMLVFSLAACGNNENTDPSGSDNPGVSQSNENNAGGEETKGWPTEGMGSLIPEPKWDYEITHDGTYFVATFENVSMEDLKAYTVELTNAGFDANFYETGEGSWWQWQATDFDNGAYVVLETYRVTVKAN